MSRDNWERLVAAVIKRDQIWQLCHQDSITTISSDFSERSLSFSSHVSSPSSPLVPHITKDLVVKDKKSASATITHKLFSALLWRRKPKDYDMGEGLVGISEDLFGLRSFSLRELLIATDDFSEKNMIRHHYLHGKVFKGRLADGSLVAVKREKAQVIDQVMIMKVLEISSLVAHRNVLNIRGFCNLQTEWLLVYPYMANGSVASCLRERVESEPPLHWEKRQSIALGVAKGLDYLHHECVRGIIHRDIKAANILLDEDYEAVVSDFTLAKFVDCYDDDGIITGTIYHIAPEHLITSKYSVKSDVFGYGIFLLELISAKQSFDLARLATDEGMMFLNWVRQVCEEEKFEVMVDLGGNYVDKEVEKLLQVSLICTQDDPERRPTMSEVVRMLEDGEGFAESWQEFFSLNLYPSSEWIIDYSSVSEDELSEPR